MSKNKIKPLSRKTDIVIQEHGNEILIYDLIKHRAFSLNETSALVWQACDGSKTVREISNQLSGRLNSPVSETFVWLALEQLKRENLIENKSKLSMPYEGLSRREVIHRAGLASLVTLPMVSSLIAPVAINAQSLGAICAVGACRCPNATPDTGNCAGSTTPVTVNCNTVSGSPLCDCKGPFGAPGSGLGPGGAAFRQGSGCRT